VEGASLVAYPTASSRFPEASGAQLAVVATFAVLFGLIGIEASRRFSRAELISLCTIWSLGLVAALELLAWTLFLVSRTICERESACGGTSRSVRSRSSCCRRACSRPARCGNGAGHPAVQDVRLEGPLFT
jgi:hypothetical protein